MNTVVSPSSGGPTARDDEVLLQVDNLRVAYGNIHALHDVTLQVRPGQVVAVLGPNGAGKSTLVRTISGLLRPRGGHVDFAGMRIGGGRPSDIARAGVVHVPEGREIFGSMSVWENLKVAFDNLGDPDTEKEKFERVYELFPILRERGQQLAGNLSGGQQQMLAIARVLLGRPRLLILDEPSLGLAEVIVREIYATLDELRNDGITILLIEQNANMAMAFADYTYVLVGGRIVVKGSREQLDGQGELIKHYLGSPE